MTETTCISPETVADMAALNIINGHEPIAAATWTTPDGERTRSITLYHADHIGVSLWLLAEETPEGWSATRFTWVDETLDGAIATFNNHVDATASALNQIPDQGETR